MIAPAVMIPTTASADTWKPSRCSCCDSAGSIRPMVAGTIKATMNAEIVAPVAWPISRVVSSIPDANPRASVGSVLITVALFTVLKMFVPTEIGNSRSGSNQNDTEPANIASSTNPDRDRQHARRPKQPGVELVVHEPRNGR